MTNVDIGRYSKRIVQFLWDPEPPNNDAPAYPIWCLGQCYHSSISRPSTSSNIEATAVSPPSESSSSSERHTKFSETSSIEQQSPETSFEEVKKSEAPLAYPEHEEWPPAFLDDFGSRIWLTYRSGFQPIPKSQDPKAPSTMSLRVRLKSQFGSQDGFTSDSGWGCMIRSGQCLLANALVLLHMGRDWRRGAKEDEERKLLRMFADDPKAPFSVHNFVQHGAAACGTYPGQWFGPSATAKCIQALSDRHAETGLRVYVTGDGPDVYEDAMFRIAKQGLHFHPTLLLVGTRLGIDRITPVYWEAVKDALHLPQSVGIAGGRPSASHYFIGTQGSNFFYLDPHHTRAALPIHEQDEDLTLEEIDSCHTCRLRRIPIEEMDPSMLIAFLIKDEDEWRSWRRGIAETKGKPIVHVADSEPSQHGFGVERDGAVDEVQTFDDDDDDDEEKEFNKHEQYDTPRCR